MNGGGDVVRIIPDFDPDGLLGLKEMEIASAVFASSAGQKNNRYEDPMSDSDSP